MKWILVLYLTFGHPIFDQDEYSMAAVSHTPYDTAEECLAAGEALRDSGELPEFAIVGHHCMESTWSDKPQKDIENFREEDLTFRPTRV